MRLLFALVAVLPCFGALSLTDNATNYQIDNTYFRAVIPKNGNASAGLVNHLYVYKADGVTLSADLAYQSSGYGFGWLEGSGDATANDAIGIGSQATTTVTLLVNSASVIVIRATITVGSTRFTQIWTFWDLPYFRADAQAVRTDTGTLVNQFQFANMINNTTAGAVATWGSDHNGTARQFSQRSMQPITRLTSTYPWINYQFTDQTVSLGIVFTDINDGAISYGETGDWQYEYQIDWEYSSGRLSAAVDGGNERRITQLYYTSNAASNTAIIAYATSAFIGAALSSVRQPAHYGSFLLNNPYGQNAGYGSVIQNAPYFAVRQNAQNPSVPHYSQYQTSIYAPLWSLPIFYFSSVNYDVINSIFPSQGITPLEDFREHLVFSLNYDNDSTTYTYGTITPSSATNGATTSIIHSASSTDTMLAYASTLTTWTDSDKLAITGTASNGASCTPNCPVKDIWVSLQIPATYWRYAFFANTATPAAQIVNDPCSASTHATDNKWDCYTGYAYTLTGYPGSQKTLIFRDSQETVQNLGISLSTMPNGTYPAVAGVKRSTIGDMKYAWSSDNSAYTNFTVASGTAVNVEVDLGTATFSAYPANAFYIGQGNPRTGTADWGGWTYVRFGPAITSLGSNIYDVQYVDPVYGAMGIAIKVNSPTDNITVSLGTLANAVSDLRVYLYKQAAAQTLTPPFSYAYDVELWPHSGFLTNAAQYTALHSQTPVAFQRRLIGGTSAVAF